MNYLLISILSLFLSHDFHVSKCDITYRSQTHSLEIIHHVFIDDFESALMQDFDGILNLGSDKEVDEADALVEKYFLEHFSLSNSTGNIDLNYLGKEVADEPIAMWIYIEATGIEHTSDIDVRYDVLCELFSDQKNILSFRVDNGEKQMFLMDKDNYEAKIVVQ